MGNEVAQASERKSLIITPFGTIFFHQPPAREEGVGGCVQNCAASSEQLESGSRYADLG